MERDDLGICLSSHLLSSHLYSTFTSVRAYKVDSSDHNDVTVIFSSPQMTGRDVLKSMETDDELEWRAEHLCCEQHHF
ncbi:hypothetical protein [Vibrio palustris]|uniref:Uncharacterized protein n=1 Tax=Vibrio palustris TaxID=1918946 RepID=A0A1R4B286_9VIBR|nr:hypothetical protein [Vibrio palustris]SJL83025.1 hypothetical protein VPAL9027_00971 [Vibrio palustris]